MSCNYRVPIHTRLCKIYLSLDLPRVRSVASTVAMHSRKHLPFAKSALLVERREILRAFRRFSRDPPCRISMEGSTARPNRLVLTREIGMERGSCQRLSPTFVDSRDSSERFLNGRGLWSEVTTLAECFRVQKSEIYL